MYIKCRTQQHIVTLCVYYIYDRSTDCLIGELRAFHSPCTATQVPGPDTLLSNGMRSQIVRALGWCLGCMLLSCSCGNTVANGQSSVHMAPHTCVYVCVEKPCREFFWFLFSICQLSESPLRMSLFSQTPSRPQGDGSSAVPRNSGKNCCGKGTEGSGLLTCHSKTR